MKITLTQKLDRQLLATTDERIKLLKEIGIDSVADLMQYFPRGHEDMTVPTNLAELRGDEKNLLKGVFRRVWDERTPNRTLLVKALFEEEQSGGQVECVWFNNRTIRERIPVGVPVLLSGKAKIAYGKISLQAPEFEIAGRGVHFGRIMPIYREHGALKSAWFRQKIYELIDHTEIFPEILPTSVRAAAELMPRHEAVIEVHFPKGADTLKTARRTLSFEELFLLQLGALLRKKKWEAESRGNVLHFPLDAELMKAFFASLPYTPTASQKIAIYEILKDFEKPLAMLRVLEGDVGSGKTLVAVTAALAVIRAGGQAAFLAPTEILARQHQNSIAKLLQDFDQKIRVEALTGATKGKAREQILDDLRYGKIHLLVGTHALLEDPVVFRRLGLVVIDEQHRFGVEQREKIIRKGAPHVLQMTATPIPRTLAIVAFGDQDLSVLLELPPGRKAIITRVVPPAGRRQIELFIEQQVGKGRQGYIICPLVEESEKLEVKAATEEFSRLQEVFPHLRLELLHGRMKASQKDEVMRRFQNHEFDLLVSTAVVEVGVDVANATMILIEGAERFGLSQLHQFRGRVGRGKEQSYCFLFPTGNETDRLKAMEKESCGFRLAEIDLKLRGPGHIYGLRQSGIPDLKMGDILDPRAVVEARQAAEKFLETEGLDAYPHLAEKIAAMEAATVT